MHYATSPWTHSTTPRLSCIAPFLFLISQALSGLSLAKYVQSSPALMRMLKPVANAYANATGHRQMGLRYDDLMVEESSRVQKAISRLPEKEAYDRAFRLRQAAQLSVLHRELPKEQWLPAKEVSFPYVP